jgi:hypothetical protein
MVECDILIALGIRTYRKIIDKVSSTIIPTAHFFIRKFKVAK